MFVREIMTREPITVAPDTRIRDAALVLSSHGITAVPVVDHSGLLCGVLSEADVLRDAFEPDPRRQMIRTEVEHTPPGDLVADVMTRQVISVHPSTDVAEAVDLMTSTAVKSLPVVDERGHLIGILSRSDLVGLRGRADAAIEREVDALLVSLGHTDWLVGVHDGSVQVDGPATLRERSLAETAAASVAGVVSVRVN